MEKIEPSFEAAADSEKEDETVFVLIKEINKKLEKYYKRLKNGKDRKV